MEVGWSTLSQSDKALIEKDWTANTNSKASKDAASLMENTINAAIDKANKDKGTSVSHNSIKNNGNKGFTVTSGLDGSGASSIGIKGLPTTD